MKNKDSVYLVFAILVILSLFVAFSISNKNFITKQPEIKKSPEFENKEQISTTQNNKVNVVGILEVVHTHDSNLGTGKIGEFYILNSNGNLYYFAEEDKSKLRDFASGEEISLEGYIDENNIVRISNINSESNFAQVGAFDSFERLEGGRRTVVLIVNFLGDNDRPLTTDQVRGIMFDNSDSVSAFYTENSYNLFSYNGDVFGWYTLNIHYNVDLCSNGLLTIIREAISVSDPDIYFPDYDQIVVAFYPYRLDCAQAGMGAGIALGSSPINWNTNDGIVPMYAAIINGHLRLHTVGHELGHNLGLIGGETGGHSNGWECGTNIAYGSCEEREYRDSYDIMGGENPFHMNAIKKDFMGWFSQSQVIEVTNTIGGTYDIEPIETNDQGIKVVKVPKRYNVDTCELFEWYYIEYRRPIGFDNDPNNLLINNGVDNGAWIHYNDHMQPVAYTRLLDMTPQSIGGNYPDDDFYDGRLGVGQTYTDVNYGVVTIRTIERTATGIRVEVSLTQPYIYENPTIEIIPQQQIGQGQPLTYTVNFRNNNSPNCPSYTHYIRAYGPNGWRIDGYLFPRNIYINIASGQTITRTYSIEPPEGVEEGTYPFTFTIRSNRNPGRASANGSYVVDYPNGGRSSPIFTPILKVGIPLEIENIMPK